MDFFGKLRQRTATAGIIGSGDVGPHLTFELARAGFQTIGIPNVSSEALAHLVRSARVRTATKYSLLKAVNAVSIRVPTPIDTTRAECEFSFRARNDFLEGLKRTIDWYRSVRSKP